VSKNISLSFRTAGVGGGARRNRRPHDAARRMPIRVAALYPQTEVTGVVRCNLPRRTEGGKTRSSPVERKKTQTAPAAVRPRQNPHPDRQRPRQRGFVWFFGSSGHTSSRASMCRNALKTGFFPLPSPKKRFSGARPPSHGVGAYRCLTGILISGREARSD